tara:strand:- start:113 stop:562 length:450 start_codon:yes stop_codon:yes gene_type:complete
MKSNHFETILGMLTILIALSFLLKFLSANSNNTESDYYQLNAKFLKVGGLIVGNDVKMSGVKIGVITHVSLDDEYMANVAFQVFSSIQIPSDSVASIKSDGILGNKYLSISPNNRESKFFMTENQSLENVEDFESIEDQVSRIIFLATQ